MNRDLASATMDVYRYSQRALEQTVQSPQVAIILPPFVDSASKELCYHQEDKPLLWDKADRTSRASSANN